MKPEEQMISPEYSSKLEQRIVFFLVFIGTLTLTYGFFLIVDFLPEKPDATASAVETTDTSTIETTDTSVVAVPILEPEMPETVDPYPVRIIFDSLEGRTVTVLNPESRSIEALDAALMEGVVRHPDSADFEHTGTVFLFGHSSYLPSVINKNFQAFNGIQNMKWGDTIRLQSSNREYVYRVDRVYEVSAEDAEVKIETGKPKLTLVTCDSFGSKSDRFIVEASLVNSNMLLEGNVSG